MADKQDTFGLEENSPLWTETEDDVQQVHAFFGGRKCWLKNGSVKCGNPYGSPIHKIVYPECVHSFVCDNCGDELPHKPSPAPAADTTAREHMIEDALDLLALSHDRDAKRCVLKALSEAYASSHLSKVAEKAAEEMAFRSLHPENIAAIIKQVGEKA